MPELCEVQIMTENLSRWCLGHSLIHLHSMDDKFQDIPFQELQDSPVVRVWRRAKIQYFGNIKSRNDLTLSYDWPSGTKAGRYPI